MKTRILRFGTYVVLAVLLVVLLARLGRDELRSWVDSYIVDTQYDEYSALMAGESVQRGWLPDFLPQSTTNIFERHSLDTNEVWARFEIANDDVDKLVARCRPVDRQAIRWPRNPNRFRNESNVAWWDAGLDSGETESTVHRLPGRGATYIALGGPDGPRTTVFLWTGSR